LDRFERRKEKSKDDIRRAAEELFPRFGIDKVSINDIADRAGVSQATVYNNFGSKEELVSDYRKTINNKIAERFHDILVWKKSYFEKFQGFLQSWIDFADKYRVETASRGSRGESEDNRSRSILSQEIEKALLEFIEEGKKQGHIDPELSDEAIMVYMKFFQEGISAHPEIQKKLNHDPELTQDLLFLFMYGVNGKCNPAT
jgi:AcrR family transcriptional regulator